VYSASKAPSMEAKMPRGESIFHPTGLAKLTSGPYLRRRAILNGDEQKFHELPCHLL
jgi:hypothetical protein